MPHPLVDQLRFTRSEFQRALKGVTDEEARQRFMPMNSISWIVGHLANQEQRYWLVFGAGQAPVAPELINFGFGKPPSTPPLDEVWQAWHAVTQATNPYLDSLTSSKLLEFVLFEGKPNDENIGSMLRRVTYHYWYHTGESQAIRQMLGHTDLPTFVGDIGGEAPYCPEA
jgi:hypothetical protein